MLRTVLNKSSKQYYTKQSLHSHLPPILQTIQVRHKDLQGTAGEERMTLSYELQHINLQVSVDKIYINLFYTDTRCDLEDLPGATYDRDRWREKVKRLSVRLDYLSIYLFIERERERERERECVDVLLA